MEEAQLLNDADSLIYTAEKTKTDLVGKISDSDVAKIDAATKDLRKAIESKDAQEMKAKSDVLRKTLQDVGTAVYQQAAQAAQSAQPGQPEAQGGASQPGAEPSAAPGSGPVTDADYKVVDEEKKQ